MGVHVCSESGWGEYEDFPLPWPVRLVTSFPFPTPLSLRLRVLSAWLGGALRFSCLAAVSELDCYWGDRPGASSLTWWGDN